MFEGQIDEENGYAQAHLTDGYKALYHHPYFLANPPTHNQSQSCLYALYVLSQRSEEERPWQTSRDQDMKRPQEERKMMHRMADAAADAAAAAAVVVGPCSSLHLSQGAAAADTGRPSVAQIHVPQ